MYCTGQLDNDMAYVVGTEIVSAQALLSTCHRLVCPFRKVTATITCTYTYICTYVCKYS